MHQFLTNPVCRHLPEASGLQESPLQTCNGVMRKAPRTCCLHKRSYPKHCKNVNIFLSNRPEKRILTHYEYTRVLNFYYLSVYFYVKYTREIQSPAPSHRVLGNDPMKKARTASRSGLGFPRRVGIVDHFMMSAGFCFCFSAAHNRVDSVVCARPRSAPGSSSSRGVKNVRVRSASAVEQPPPMRGR